MNRRLKRYLGFVTVLFFKQAVSQQQISSTLELEALRAAPMETLYLHLNRTTLFPGETLYFSIYSIDLQSYRLSKVSKIAYVQLTDANGTQVSVQKIRLYQGRGQGDLFINTKIPSGAYTLTSFTNWIKNAGVNQFYTAEINVINPYESTPGILIGASSENIDSGALKTISVEEHTDSDTGILIRTSCTSCPINSSVTLQLQNLKGVLAQGSYSISVARVEEIPEIPSVTASGFASAYANKLRRIPQQVLDSVWIPEQREAIIAGKLIDSNKKIGLAGVPIVISLPGENFQLLTATTNATGQFFAYLKAPYEGATGYFNTTSGIAMNQQVIFQNLGQINEKFPSPRRIVIDTSLAGAIRKRSIHNQIENGYFEVKPDTVRSVFTEESYFGYLPRSYDLDDYTSFSTLRETLIEIIQDVWVKKDSDKTETLWVRAPSEIGREIFTIAPPIVTIDGIFIPNHGEILDLDARLLKYIRVVQDEIIFGDNKYQGMVALETRYGDYTSSGTPFEFSPAAPVKSYFQEFPDHSRNRIPDFRHQLYWNPRIDMNQYGQSFKFMTSRVPGTYSVTLEGFTSYGKPVTLKSYFEVKE
ncbi:MAG: hypothetical protein RLZZ241_1841 [Bacteroidota bacterium]|jgi:hypothetical protein